jgi:hypothetical protein
MIFFFFSSVRFVRSLLRLLAGFRAIGAGVVLSAVGAVFINGGLGPKTIPVSTTAADIKSPSLSQFNVTVFLHTAKVPTLCFARSAPKHELSFFFFLSSCCKLLSGYAQVFLSSISQFGYCFFVQFIDNISVDEHNKLISPATNFPFLLHKP